MTCAHVVNVALKKTPGVETVEVSLNKGLATVKLKPGNTVSIPQLWSLIHEKGYTPKATTVTVRGELAQGVLKVTGTRDVLTLAGATAELSRKLGQTVVLHGIMTPGKDFKTPVPLQVSDVK